MSSITNQLLKLFNNQQSFPDVVMILPNGQRWYAHRCFLMKSKFVSELPNQSESDYVTYDKGQYIIHLSKWLPSWLPEKTTEVLQQQDGFCQALWKWLERCYGIQESFRKEECPAALACLLHLRLEDEAEYIKEIEGIMFEPARSDYTFGAKMLLTCVQFNEFTNDRMHGICVSLAKLTLVFSDDNDDNRNKVVFDCVLKLPPEYLDHVTYGEAHSDYGRFAVCKKYVETQTNNLTPDQKKAVMRKCKVEEMDHEELTLMSDWGYIDINDVLRYVGSVEPKKIVAENVEKQKHACEEAVKKGDSNAMVELGRYYEKGIGTERKTEEAIKWYSEASERGNVEGAREHARCFDASSGLRKEEQKTQSFNLWKTASEMGDAYATFKLGECYRQGIGVEKNPEEAFKQYLAAAKMNNPDAAKYRCPDALFRCGKCYEFGEGVEQDHDEAFELYEQGARMQHSDSMVSLGLCYENGQGVAKDRKKAFDLFKKASEMDNPDAFYHVGRCYDEGIPGKIPADKNEALAQYTHGAEKGDSKAMTQLAMHHWNNRVENKKKEARELLEKASNLENTDAMTALAHILLKGYPQIGIPQDKEKATGLLQRAACLGNPAGMALLAQCMLDECKNRKEEQKRKEDESKKSEEEARIADEEAKKADEEAKGKAESAKKADEEAQNAEEAVNKNSDEEKDQGTEEAKQKREHASKLKEEATKLEQEANEKKNHAKALMEEKEQKQKIVADLKEEEEKQKKEIIEYLSRASELGNPDAMLTYGKCYEDGFGVEQDKEEAYKLYEKAAQGGNTEAMTIYGIYLHTTSTEKEKNEEGLDWLNKAKRKGDSGAESYITLHTF